MRIACATDDNATNHLSILYLRCATPLGSRSRAEQAQPFNSLFEMRSAR